MILRLVLQISEKFPITSAFLQFKTEEKDTGEVSLTIVGEDVDDAAEFEDVLNNISSRVNTTASVSWPTVDEWNTIGEAGPSQRSTDISSILQEIVDRPSWSSGNAIVLKITGSGSNHRGAESFDGDAAGAPLLHIEEEVNTPPTVIIIEPPDNSEFVQGTNIMFEATATDAQDDNSVVTADIVWNSNLDGDFGISGGSNPFSMLSLGEHTITATATDSGTLMNTEQITVTIVVPPTPPIVEITSPLDGLTFPDGTNINFTATATDAEDDDMSVTDSIVWNSDLDNDFGVTGGSNPFSGLSIGVHNIRATATDSGSLEGFDEITITVIGANMPPTVSISAPANNATFDEGENIPFAATANDTEDGDVTPSIVWNSDVDGDFGVTGGMNPFSTLTVGMHTIRATATDSGSLEGFDEITITVIEANMPPMVSISAPANDATFDEGENIPFAATANDVEDGDVTNSIIWNSSLDGDFGVSGGSNPFSTLSDGMHAIRATATDSDSLEGFDEISITVGVTVTLDVGVLAGDDDAEERISTGVIDPDSSDLELGEEGSPQMVGVRFKGIMIPIGATIVNAYVQFQVDEVTTQAASLTVFGEDIDNAPIFTSSNGDISSRTPTSASVPWDPAPWPTVGAAGLDQRTPNITSVIQEIVNRGGWSIGNSMAIIITGTGRRTAESFNGDGAGAAAKLHVEYTTEGGNLPPTVSISAPEDGAIFALEDMITFTGAAMDVEDDNASLTAGLDWVSDIEVGSIGTGGTFDLSTLSVGTHMITASVTDSGGLLGSATITISILIIDPIPIVSISSPADGATFTEGDTITFTGAAMDAEDDNATLTAGLGWGSDMEGGSIGTGGTFDLSTLSVGTHMITASVTNSGGLPASDSITISVGGTTLDVGVLSGDDDAEERVSTGTVDLSSSDLELVLEGSIQTVGVRFNDLTIPSGATIVNAYVQFQVDEVTTQAASLTVVGEDINNAPIFTSATGDISSRTATSASVAWDPAPWPTVGEAGPDQRTPDITSVIQEIVNRGGWSIGNSMAIIITGTGRRTAESFNGDGAGAAAKLHVEYTTEGGNLPPTVAISEPSDGATFTEEDNITFTATATDPEDGNIAANLTWDSSLDGAFGPGGGSFSLDTLSVGTHTITASVTDSDDAEGGDEITVTITGPVDPIIEVRVSDGDDDAEESNPTGNVIRASSDLELVDESTNQTVGMRFTGLNIPNGATITNAYIQFQADEVRTEAASLTIFGEDIDSAPTFTSALNNITSRTPTSASVGWIPAPWPIVGAAGPDQQTPNINSVIQEIVDRGGWASGNSIAIIFTGTGRRTAESHNGDSAAAALLHVEYTP